jgi:hypothetical protein
VNPEDHDRLATLIGWARLEGVRDHGAVVLDVDDTLLPRPTLLGEDRAEESGQQMGAVIRSLLKTGVRVTLITGHGWEQLQHRWVEPCLLDEPEGAIQNLLVYANRGATKVVFDGAGFAEDRSYGERHAIAQEHRISVLQLLSALQQVYVRDLQMRPSWYGQAFPRFDFDEVPTVSLREEVVAVLRPLPSRAHASEAGADPRSDLSARGRTELNRLGLSGLYEVGECGRSTIEVIRRGVSKRIAVEDLIQTLSATTGTPATVIEGSLIYVGDEFFLGGNDLVVSASFPRCLCLSVSPLITRVPCAWGVIDLTEQAGESGPAATLALLTFLLQRLSGETGPLT